MERVRTNRDCRLCRSFAFFPFSPSLSLFLSRGYTRQGPRAHGVIGRLTHSHLLSPSPSLFLSIAGPSPLPPLLHSHLRVSMHTSLSQLDTWYAHAHVAQLLVSIWTSVCDSNRHFLTCALCVPFSLGEEVIRDQLSRGNGTWVWKFKRLGLLVQGLQKPSQIWCRTVEKLYFYWYQVQWAVSTVLAFRNPFHRADDNEKCRPIQRK